MNKFHALVDSDAFVGWLIEADANHRRSVRLLEQARQNALPLVTTNLVIAETATVLSNRSGQPLARTFLDTAEHFPTIYLTEELHRESVKVFHEQPNKNTSFVDCSNVVVVQHFQIPTIFSFDQFYLKRFGLKIAV